MYLTMFNEPEFVYKHPHYDFFKTKMLNSQY